MQSAAQRARYVRLGAWLILVLAFIPNISYIGHWPEIAGGVHAHDDAATLPVDPGALHSETDDHTAHCHVGPARCGGGESMIGTPFVGDDTGGIVLPRHESEIDAERMLAALSGHATPILQPPRFA